MAWEKIGKCEKFTGISNDGYMVHSKLLKYIQGRFYDISSRVTVNLFFCKLDHSTTLLRK